LLIDAVIHVLQLVRERDSVALSDAHLDVLEVDGDTSGEIVIVYSHRTVLNRGHLMVATALDAFDRDPTWVMFLASAVYTAINERLAHITDTHELHVHHALAQYVAPRLGADEALAAG